MVPKIGDVIYVQSYKHDHSLHRTWSSGTVLDIDAEKIVCITYKTWVIEANGRKWFTREPAICFYYLNRWYNVIAMIRKTGIYYYCNLASPSVYDQEALKNIDYDLDVKVFPEGNYVILDEDEFALHQKEMNYPPEVIAIVEAEMERIVESAKYHMLPFDDHIVNDYFQRYLELERYI